MAKLCAVFSIPYFDLFELPYLKNYGRRRIHPRIKSNLESNLIINKPLFWISTYLYIILTCGLAIFLQTELVTGNESVLLWKYLLGIAG